MPVLRQIPRLTDAKEPLPRSSQRSKSSDIEVEDETRRSLFGSFGSGSDEPDRLDFIPELLPSSTQRGDCIAAIESMK
eukprot:scaffold149813_cov37-Prasinocladus_malaysianus.AAC.1